MVTRTGHLEYFIPIPGTFSEVSHECLYYNDADNGNDPDDTPPDDSALLPDGNTEDEPPFEPFEPCPPSKHGEHRVQLHRLVRCVQRRRTVHEGDDAQYRGPLRPAVHQPTECVL